MTRDQLQQKTSRGETFYELLRRAWLEWQPPESVDAALDETEKTQSEGSENAQQSATSV